MKRTRTGCIKPAAGWQDMRHPGPMHVPTGINRCQRVPVTSEKLGARAADQDLGQRHRGGGGHEATDQLVGFEPGEVYVIQPRKEGRSREGRAEVAQVSVLLTFVRSEASTPAAPAMGTHGSLLSMRAVLTCTTAVLNSWKVEYSPRCRHTTCSKYQGRPGPCLAAAGAGVGAGAGTKTRTETADADVSCSLGGPSHIPPCQAARSLQVTRNTGYRVRGNTGGLEAPCSAHLALEALLRAVEADGAHCLLHFTLLPRLC